MSLPVRASAGDHRAGLTDPDTAVAGACSAGGGLGSAAVRRRPSPISLAMVERRAE
jgi:hypothetical protein